MSADGGSEGRGEEPEPGRSPLFGDNSAAAIVLPIGLLLMALLLWIAMGETRGRSPTDSPPPVSAGASSRAPSAADFTPPDPASIPDGPFGDAVRRGQDIFMHTGKMVGNHVGSGLTCSNCHLDAGRKADASPMWAAWGKYPQYREKNKQINTMEDRILGCFIYSMNAGASPSGKPPPPGDDVYRDLEAYFFWLATGAPTGKDMKGAGFLKLKEPAMPYDPARGAPLYAEKCASCHGDNGQGMANPDGTYAFPPLWGDHSFNWGAGMTKISNAAGFIKANMPFGEGMTLSDQDAWDLAAFVDSHERPRDPRQTGSIADAKARHHKSGDYYGETVGGDLLGDGKP